MRAGLTEIVFILDKSGSMCGLEDDTIGGYNSFLEKQKQEEGKAFVSTVLFSDESKVIHDRVDINNILPMTENDYEVGGCTALLDAIGKSIHHIANIHKYAREEDVPEKTVFVITTDGEENSSIEYNYKTLKKLITKEQEKYGWEFLFLGANMDAIEEASKIGIHSDHAVKYRCDGMGTATNYDCLSQAMCSIRRGEMLCEDWKSEIEKHERTGK